MKIDKALVLNALKQPFSTARKVICFVIGIYFTWRYVDSGCGRIRLTFNPLKLRIRKAKDSTFILNGLLNISSYLMDAHEGVLISIDAGAILEIRGDFSIGNGSQIVLHPNSHLSIGGKDLESSAGITERTRIMVKKKITIGKDLLCAWGVFITDCDWHHIENNNPQYDVTIGNHVWIAPNCQLLKGAKIGHGCIVANGTVITRKKIPDGCLVGGNPPKVLKTGVEWKRDLPQ